MRTICGTILVAAMAVGGVGSADTFADKDGSCPISTNVRGHENIEWSTSYAYGLTDETKDLPRVLLVGDSICSAYQSGVRVRLKGRLNVTYWVSSYCVTSPAYLRLLSIYLDEAKYDVIHLNNGHHTGKKTPMEAYAKGLKSAFELIRRKQPQAKLIWCSTTPLKSDAMTAMCRARNEAAARVAEEIGGVATDDLFALCDPLDRKRYWKDNYHFYNEAVAMQAERVAASVLSVLESGLDAPPAMAKTAERLSVDESSPLDDSAPRLLRENERGPRGSDHRALDAILNSTQDSENDNSF